MSSKISDIKSINSLVTELPGLINNVLCNLKSAIGLNITLVCLIKSNIDKSIKCCKSKVREAVNIINCINNLINSKCKSSKISCFQKCLNEIKCNLQKLYLELHKLYCFYCYINCLKNETQNMIKCSKDISTLKTKICELIKRYKCSINEFKCIESKIKCIKCIINQLNELKQKLCKQIDKFLFYICINIEFTWSLFPFNISSLTKESLQKNIKCLTGKMDEICSQFTTIEDNSIKLKHSLMFNEMYFEISSNILNELECIQSSAEKINPKTGDLKQLESLISVISGNVNYVKSMIEGIDEGANDLAYLRNTMKYIMPKLCQTKDIANKITKLESIIEPLRSIKSSIDNLKKEEYDKVCLQILECYDGISVKTVTCITDNLNINCITAKLETVQNGISSLNTVFCNIKNLLGYIETIENILSVIDYLKRNISKLANKFLRCSLDPLTPNIIVNKIVK